VPEMTWTCLELAKRLGFYICTEKKKKKEDSREKSSGG
jgi:hypothetical protein